MKLQGKTLSEIAEYLEYKSPKDVTKDIQAQMKTEADFIPHEDKKGILAMEVARLDKLQSAVWSAAMYGDPQAVDRAIKIIQTRSKLLGLDLPDTETHKTELLVIGGLESEYVKRLKELANE